MADRFIQQVQQQQRQPVMQQRAAAKLPEPVIEKSSADSFISSVFRITNEVIPVINTELQKKIKVDQVKQTARAFAGLLPSEDATNSGIAAHHLIDVQNGIVESSNNYNTWLSDRYKQDQPPSQQEIDEKRAEINTELLNKYPDVGNDQIISRFITMKLQEAVPAVKAMEVKAKSDYFSAQGTKALKSSVADMSKLASPTDVVKALPAYYATAATLGKSRDEANAELFSWAKAEAELGKGNMLAALEGNPEFKNDSRIQSLRNAYDKASMSYNITELGTLRANLSARYVQGDISDAEFDAEVNATNSKFNYDAMSISWVEGVKSQRINALRNQQGKFNALNTYDAYSSPVPFKMNPMISDREKSELPEQFTKRLQQGVNQMVADGKMTPEQGQEYIAVQLGMHSEASLLKFPVLQNMFDGWASLNPQSFKGNNVPPEVSNLLTTMSKLPSNVRSMYMSDDQAVAFDNYLFFRRNSSDADALRKMQIAKDSPRLDITTKKVQDAITSGIDDVFPDSYFGGGKIPKWQEARLKAEALRKAQAYLKAGAFDEKVAVDIAMRSLSGEYSRVFNNSYINATPAQLGGAGFLVSKDGKLDHVNEAMQMWVTDNLPALREKSLYGNKLNGSNIRFEFNNGLITVYDPYGNIISKGARPAAEFHARFDKEQQERAIAQAKKVQDGQAKGWFSQGRFTIDASPAAYNAVMDAQIVHESAGKQFDASGKTTTSPKGAVGVAQVMPSAIAQLLQNEGRNTPENRAAWFARAKTDAKFNREIGVNYMKYLGRRFNNELFSMVAAYNGGEGRVSAAIAKAKKQHGAAGANYNLYKEHLPKETRDYVSRVTKTLNAKGAMALQPSHYYPKEVY